MRNGTASGGCLLISQQIGFVFCFYGDCRRDSNKRQDFNHIDSQMRTVLSAAGWHVAATKVGKVLEFDHQMECDCNGAGNPALPMDRAPWG